MKVTVHNSDIESALRLLKKKSKRESLHRKCKEITYYQKKS